MTRAFLRLGLIAALVGAWCGYALREPGAENPTATLTWITSRPSTGAVSGRGSD